MIAVIVCSKRAELCENIAANISSTIGVPYEFIAVDNKSNDLNIAQAYNRGASKATYPLLCFVHEDVIFHTAGWGQKVMDHFIEDAGIGLLGIAGGSYKLAAPSSWFPPVERPDWFPIHQHLLQYVDGRTELENVNPLNETVTRVASLDGVWFCCRKKIWEQAKFDESLPGFHGYDIDFSLQVNKIAKVVVVYDILLEHLSPGNFDPGWMKVMYRLHKKWNRQLPVNYTSLSLKERRSIEVSSRARFIYLMKYGQFSPLQILNVIWGMGSFRFFNGKQFFEWNAAWLPYVVRYCLNKSRQRARKIYQNAGLGPTP